MRIDRLAHRFRAFLQAAISFTRAADFHIEREDAVNRYARILRHLPFLPRDVQIDRAKVFPRGGLLRQKWNEGAEFPTSGKIITGLRPGGVAPGDVIAFV